MPFAMKSLLPQSLSRNCGSTSYGHCDISLSRCCPFLSIVYPPQKQSVFVLWLTYKIQLPHQSPGWAADAGSIKHFSYSQKFKRIIEDLRTSQSQEKNFRWWNRALLFTCTLDKKHWKVDLTFLSWREHMLLLQCGKGMSDLEGHKRRLPIKSWWYARSLFDIFTFWMNSKPLASVLACVSLTWTLNPIFQIPASTHWGFSLGVLI